MCGIVGIAHINRHPVDREVLTKMTRVLAHRGPDDEGVEIIRDTEAGLPDGDGHIGFGHRRLSIIDLTENGRQPLANEDGTVWITYNGEIYNFPELRAELIRRGHRFRSNSDTEVIIHGYEQYGEAVFGMLNGMFAFGLWDGRNRLLYLVRDRFGQKPLFYWQSSKGLVFASELKSFLEHPDFLGEIDLPSLSRYLAFEYVPAPHTIFQGVAKLLPGHFLRWRSGEIQLSPYWRIRFDGADTVGRLSEREIEGLLVGSLKESIRRRLLSDVPLGVFLSGGIDSSSIVALMSELIPAEEIRTFSIGFQEKSFDESGYARAVARQFGTEHREKIFTPEEMLQILPEVWDFLDEPFADPSILPTYLLSKFTRQHVTVALGGDGGDELFAGYDPFVAHRLARYYQMVPRVIHDGILYPLARQLPVSTANMSLDFKLKQFLKGASYKHPGVRNQVWLGSFSKKEQQGLLSPEVAEQLNGFDPYEDISGACGKVAFRDPLDELVFLYSRFYLADDILAKVDRASMATSLEVRAPYLDVEFAELANNIPSGLKMKGLTRKYILKRSLEGRLPKRILYRKKKGFGIPLAQWFRGELKPILTDVFSNTRLNRDGLFNAGAVQSMLDRHFQGKQDNRKQIWTLLVFEAWRQRYTKRQLLPSQSRVAMGSAA